MQKRVQDTTSGYCLCCRHPNLKWKRFHPRWDRYAAEHRRDPGGLEAEQRRAWGGWGGGWGVVRPYTGPSLHEISQIARRRTLPVFRSGSFRERSLKGRRWKPSGNRNICRLLSHSDVFVRAPPASGAEKGHGDTI